MSVRFGWVREDEWGSFKEPTLITPVSALKFSEAYEVVLDQAVRGASASKDFASFEGPGIIMGEVEGLAYPSVMDSWLHGIMGKAEAIADGYKFKLSADVPSFSFQIDDESVEEGLGLKRYAGCVLESLKLSSSDLSAGATLWAIRVLGKAAYWVPPYQPPPSADTWRWALDEETWDPDVNIRWDGGGQWGGSQDWDEGIREVTQPYPSWATVVRLGGQPVKALGVELNLARELTPSYSDYDYPARIMASPLEVTGVLSLLLEQIADYDRYLDAVQESLELVWTSGSHSMTFHATETDFTDAVAEISRDGVALSLTYSTRILYNESDEGPGYFESVNLS